MYQLSKKNSVVPKTQKMKPKIKMQTSLPNNIKIIKNEFEVINPNCLSNLANVGTIFFSKDDGAIEKKFIIKSVSNFKKLYYI